MARTAVTPAKMVANSGLQFVAGTGLVALDPTNGHTVSKGNAYQTLWLLVQNTAVAAKTITLKKGAYNLDATPGPAFRASLGDSVYSCPASSINVLGPFETARFIQADEALYVDVEAAMTGSIEAFYVPKDA